MMNTFAANSGAKMLVESIVNPGVGIGLSVPSSILEARGQHPEMAAARTKRRTMARGRVLSGLSTATAGTPAGSTWHLTAAADAAFTHIAPVFQSLETGAITVTSAAVAAIDAAGQSGMPSGFPHSGATYLPATFGGSASGTIPARIAANVASTLVGDFMPCRSLGANTNGIYWLAIRAYFAGTGYSYRVIQSVTGSAGSGSQLANRGWSQSNQNVDGVSVPANFTGTVGTNQVISGFLTLNDTGGAVFASFGDSTVAGVGSGSGCASAGVLASYQLANAGLPISHVNGGCPGRKPAEYGAYARGVITAMGRYISAASYRVSSINEQCNSAARADAHWAEAVRFVEACQHAGITPILETCPPQNLGSAAADQYRQELNDRVRAGLDWLVIDVDAACADPSEPWRYVTEYNSGDNSHMSLVGYQAVADAAYKPVLQAIF